MSGTFFRSKRCTHKQKARNKVAALGVIILGVFLSTIAFKVFAEIINDVRIETDTELTYYLTVKEDGVDASGAESSDAQITGVRGGRVAVKDELPNGLIFQGFVTTSDGTIGAVSRADKTTRCAGKVVDDTGETTTDTGTWNDGHTEYFYHGLHYNPHTRTVSFVAENIRAGCELTVGIITKTPATVDDPDTTTVETRRDFYNTAFATEKDITSISNTVHAYIGNPNVDLRKVRYSYTGDVPAGAPSVPSEESHPKHAMVTVNATPYLEGYTFSGWTTNDAVINNGIFEMPEQNVILTGSWTKNTETVKYTVAYVIDGDKPSDFMPPITKDYESGTSVLLDSTEKNSIIDGYKFSGWSTEDASLSETSFTMPEHNVTITGNFERMSYKVCYAFEGVVIPPNSDTLLPPCETHYPGDTVATAAKPTTDGYKFLGWYKGASFKMPEEDVIIQGEWMRIAGKFAPTITKSIVNPKDKYTQGDTVKFKITVTNTASYTIHDVYLKEELNGAVFTAPVDDSYIVKTDTIALIPSILSGASLDVLAEYKVTESNAQVLTNVAEMTSAIADDGYVLDTDQKYEAKVDFNIDKEQLSNRSAIITPDIPNTSVGPNVIICVVILGTCTSLATIVLYCKKRPMRYAHSRAHNVNSKQIIKLALPCLAIASILVGAIVAKNALAKHHTEVIKSIELTSQRASYTRGNPGAWNVTKSAEWISEDKARITFDVNTIAKTSEKNLDIVMVIDNSGSMAGDKITQVKHDAIELIDSILSDNNNRIGLVSFNSSATKLSNFTTNKDTLISLVKNLPTGSETNYYGGFLKAEEILEGYQRQENRELVLLFLTDGYPNMQTPNEISEYQLLKQKYPYMTINGIQYEMGEDVLDPIKQISDYQFIANMDSLNNVLFKATIMSYLYDSFTLTDYIDSEYWDIDGIDTIEASIGETDLTYDDDMPVVTWIMDGLLKSGQSARLTIDITLKGAGAIEENTLLPTNDHELVRSSLPKSSDENIASELTPVLKAGYKVTYEPNLPSACTTYDGVLPAEQNYLPKAIVQKSSNTISCDGYNFNGWMIAEGSPMIINSDYFKISQNDVVLRATWTKVSISKSMDGEAKEVAIALLDTGRNVNTTLKKLSGQSNATYETSSHYIRAIKTSGSMTPEQQASAAIISTPSSPVPIYAWFDSKYGTIYIYSSAEIIEANEDMSYMFYETSVLNNIDGVSDWNTSKVTNMSRVFSHAPLLANINGASGWDTSGVTDMSYMFDGATSLKNIDGASGWDTSNVTDMSNMFSGAKSLTNINSINNWDTSSVTNMSSMFNGATKLANIDGASEWDTSNVTDMNSMFKDAGSLINIDGASNWNTSNVTNMSGMFYGYSCDITLNNINGASNWDTSGVTDMSYMFDGATSLKNIDGASGWDTSSVTNMSRMFSWANSLTNIDGASNWDTSSVTNMSDMFRGASSLANINGASNWDTSSVIDMRYMFYKASSLTNIDGASNWDTSKVAYMNSMFSNAAKLANIDGASEWDTSNVTSMSYMFSYASSLANINSINNWNVSKVANMSYMFSHATGLTNIDGASNWNTSSATDMSNMFSYAKSLTNIDGASEWDTSKVTNMSAMFQNATLLANIDGVSYWNTSSVTNMSDMFSYINYGFTNIDSTSGWDVSKVTNMSDMFTYTVNLANINGASDWDTSSVINMSGMFSRTFKLANIDGARGWDVSKVTNMSDMFSYASGITNIDSTSGWNTSSVTDMSYMFNAASRLTNIDGASGWDTSKVTDMSYMLDRTPKLTNINGARNWDTSKVTDMSAMFYQASSLTDIDSINGWDTSSVTNMTYMFRDAINIISLNPIFDWDTRSLSNKTDMFKNIPDSIARPSWY